MKLIELTRSFYPSVGGLEKFVSDRCIIYSDLNIEYKVISTDLTVNKLYNDKAIPDVIYLRQFTRYNITPGIGKYLENNYNIISINGIGRYFSDYAIWYVNKYRKARIILTPHFTFHTKQYNSLKKLYGFLILPELLKRIDKIICFTQVEKEFWKENFKLGEDRLIIIPHYFKFNGCEKDCPSNDEKFIFYLGRNDPNKRIDLLIKAFSKLDTETKLYLTLTEADISRHLRKYLNRRIKLLGTISEKDKCELLKNCEALIYPSDFEAFGISLFEASYCKKPLLVSDIRIFREILDENGVLFFNNNIDSLVNTLNKFSVLTSGIREQMGNFNYENLEKYSYSKAKESYLKLFCELS